MEGDCGSTKRRTTSPESRKFLEGGTKVNSPRKQPTGGKEFLKKEVYDVICLLRSVRKDTREIGGERKE